MRAERVGSETLLARIVQLVGQAQRSRAPIQRLADRVAAWFVPAVVAVAAITFVAWFAFGPQPRLAHALVNAVAVLIIACPCALGLATPMAIMVGTGRGAHAGVLIKNAEALETMEKVDTLVVDKTGTLTEGKPRVVSVVAQPLSERSELLRLAASLEHASEHPLAAAVVAGRKRAESQTLDRSRIPIHHRQRNCRSSRRPQSRRRQRCTDGRSRSRCKTRSSFLARSDDDTVLCVARRRQVRRRTLAVADQLKQSTPHEAVVNSRTQASASSCSPATTEIAAAAIAKTLGITEFEAEVLPEGKLEVIRKLQQQGRVVAMAGDGINDAPALAQANVGIAMGTGTDVAMESGGITLVKGDLTGILRARKLSQATMRNIRQNLFFAFIYNAIGVPIAAGVLYPFFGILLSPIFAAAAMSFSSVSVITNALRLRHSKL